ncbi:hypothetical protein [Rathayibacter caricis]|uniref:hypothetical protein n=1 Tax=Rathayibacter caricis TaxID=110936 RepID=UPI0011B2005E|nr:hypothetical protein [Rathayibacter caricis]
MTITSISFGWLLGSLLPTPIAVPIAIFAAFQWAVSPLLDASNVSWRNIAGYAIFACCDTAAYQPDGRALLAPVVVAVGVLIAALLTFRSSKFRWLIPACGSIALTIVVANLIAVNTTATAGSLRNVADQACQTSNEVTYCVYPETLSSGEQRDYLGYITPGVTSLQDRGMVLPKTIRAPHDGSSPAEIQLDIGAGRSQPDVLIATAGAIYASLTCSPAESESDIGPDVIVPYAIALLMGGEPLSVLPPIAIYDSEVPGAVGRELTPTEVQEKLGIADDNAAESVVDAWQSSQTSCRENVN